MSTPADPDKLRAELLAPAGDMDSLRAACAAGADAVYVGYTRFSARSSASNFGEAEMREALAYCHERGVRVYTAVNTLIAPSEWDEAIGVLSFLYGAGADAVIMQDIGLMDESRRAFPDMPVHASTQMSIHNSAGAEWLKRHGVARVIAARECGVDALGSMAKVIDTEAFVHGALCVGVSGQCLFSSFVGGRSGNRGACAQPCRLSYEWSGHTGALLSPRDQAQFANLGQMISAGITSLKIEGRMKRPSYVYHVTRAYRDALGRIAAGMTAMPDEAVMQTLRQTFHRGGFCAGHVGGAEDSALIYADYAGHEGIPAAAVRSVRDNKAAAMALVDLNTGDILRAADSAFPYAGRAAIAGETIELTVPCAVRPGDTIHRQVDVALDRVAADASRPAIPVRMSFYARPGDRARLVITDCERTVEAVSREPVERAERRAAPNELIRAQLGKMGGTAYAAAEIDVDAGESHLPLSLLNGLRTRALDELGAARISAFRQREASPHFRAGEGIDGSRLRPVAGGSYHRRVTARHHDASLAQSLLDAGADAFEWSPSDMRASYLDGQARLLPRERCAFVVPEFLTDAELDGLFNWYNSNRSSFAAVVISNPGQLMLPWGAPVYADAAVHTFNARAADVLRGEGCERVTLSPELTFQQIRVIAGEGGPFDVNAYGRERLMLLSHCPAREAMGLVSGRADCRMCERGIGAHGTYLVDRRGVRFPLSRVRTETHCRLRVLNSVPTDLSRAAGFAGLPVSWRLTFWDESQTDAISIVRRYRTIARGEKIPTDITANYTTGHARRPV